MNGILDEAVGVISAVKCMECGTLHDAKGKTFVRLLGGILEGMDGGLFGGGHGDKPGSTYYCKRCFVVGIAKALGVGISMPREFTLPEKTFRSGEESGIRSVPEVVPIVPASVTQKRIESLHGLFNVTQRETPPKAVFAIIRDHVRRHQDGVASVEIEQFVRMALLSATLRQAVRAELGLTMEGGQGEGTLPKEKFSSSEDRVFTEDEGLEIQGR